MNKVRRRISPTRIGSWVVLLWVCALPLVLLPAWAARAAGSSCLECHEVQAQEPVGSLGSWHVQHAASDLCSVCHGGQPNYLDETTSHQGIRLNPMENPQLSCAICHPAEYEAQVATYSAELQMTQTARPPTQAPTPTPQATPTPKATSALAEQTPAGDAPVAATRTMPAAQAAAGGTLSPPTPAAASTPLAAPVTAPPANINWLGLLALARGPLFRTALWFFFLGMLLRLALALRSGWRHQRPPVKSGGASLAGRNILVSFGRGLLVLPFFPWLRSAWKRSRIVYIAGGIFHLGLLVVIFLSRAHMLVWKELTSLSWPTLPKPLVGWMAGLTMLAMLALLVRRLSDPLLRLLSGLGDWLNWLLVFLPVLSGFILARQWWLPYEAAYALHMLSVDVLLVWIPLSRIAHFMFYFISRSIHGLEYGKRTPAG